MQPICVSKANMTVFENATFGSSIKSLDESVIILQLSVPLIKVGVQDKENPQPAKIKS